MARTTATDVKQIMDNCSLSDAVIDAYIVAANALVTEVLGDDGTLSSTLKEEIEKWLTAHMVASTRWRTATEEKVGDVSVKYAGKFGENLLSTPYGQMVQQLDVTGKLSSDVGKKVAYLHATKQFDR